MQKHSKFLLRMQHSKFFRQKHLFLGAPKSRRIFVFEYNILLFFYGYVKGPMDFNICSPKVNTTRFFLSLIFLQKDGAPKLHNNFCVAKAQVDLSTTPQFIAMNLWKKGC